MENLEIFRKYYRNITEIFRKIRKMEGKRRRKHGDRWDGWTILS